MNVRAQAIARNDAAIEASTARAIAAREAEERAGLRVAPPRKMSAIESMSMRLGVTEQELQDALVKTVFSACRNKAEFLALIVVANEYRLNPLTKEIYAFPAKGGGVVPMVSVDGWITLMNSHPQFDGIEFEYYPDASGKGIEAIEAVIWRKDRTRPIKVIEYLEECKRNTEPWRMTARRMLRHRALIQCVRVAFGFTGIHAPDDEVMIDGGDVMTRPVAVPSRGELDATPSWAADGVVDAETGEVTHEPARDARGMTEVDEATARALDAAQANDGTLSDDNPTAREGREDEAYGDQHDDDEPAWQGAAREIEALIEAATDRASWTKAERAFQKHAAGFPDEVAATLDTALQTKRRALAGA